MRQPDIVIVEGLNVLQAPRQPAPSRRCSPPTSSTSRSTWTPTSANIERWYVERFLRLRDTVFQDPQSYFHRYGSLNEAEARRTAAAIWAEINGVNLRENIAPTRARAQLILRKGADHAVEFVQLRRL